jgi:uncharacterized protein (UPF0332 family)
VNRLYYSSYYLISALLFKSGLNAKSHNGVKIQFFNEFVRSDKISKDHGLLFSHLFDWRHESDYADFVEFEEATVIPLLSEVESLNDAILNRIVAA